MTSFRAVDAFVWGGLGRACHCRSGLAWLRAQADMAALAGPAPDGLTPSDKVSNSRPA